MSAATDLYFVQQLVGDMANFAYLIGSRSARKAFVVDPAWNVQGLLERAAKDDVEVVGALVTHYHQDHVGGEIFGHRIEGVARLLELSPMPIHVNKHEAKGVMQVTGASAGDLVAHEGGDLLELGGISVRLLHTPGHTPGSQCFLVGNRLVSGDTLFVQGCGRVDLPGGDSEEMYRTLTQRLAILPDDTVLYPGHDYGDTPTATMGEQRQSNYALRVPDLDSWLRLMG